MRLTESAFVSVVVASHDAEQTIGELLSAMAGQTLPAHRFELIVADDASTDATSELVRADPRARVVQLAERRGSYAARNHALSSARGDVIATTDADCRPDPGWLRGLLERLDETGADIAGGRIVTPLPHRASLAAHVDTARHLDQRLFVDEGFAAFASFACRRLTLDRTGPFTQALRSNGDREWCLRARAGGAKLVYAPDSVVVHPPRTSVRDVARCWWRFGVGRAQTAAHATGPAARARSNWMRAGTYAPAALAPDRHPAARRLQEAGFQGGRLALLGIDLATYVLAGCPLLAGYAAGRVLKL